MALRVRCIGVDRHVDERVPDLTGARRDAETLWALIADTFEDADTALVADEAATTAGIRRTLEETLGAAGPEDDVILAFAGHGTRDHRLVAHDTRPDALDETTVAMTELAAAFRATRARSVVCILDCCFSGAAPARVLDGTPVARSLPLEPQAFGGAGRVLIAASRPDQEAYEHPVRRHGLLTDAVVAVLTEAAVDGVSAISLVAAMDAVMARVRAEAAQMGVTQTPTLLGQVEGGLTMPTLRRGPRYRAAFPEMVRPVVGAAIADLAAYQLPPAVLAAWGDAYLGGLNTLQLAAVNDYGVLAGDSALVVAPTSGGKTFIGELAAVRAIAQGRKAVFLLPYRALVNEKYDQFQALYGERLGLRVVRCSGDFADQTRAFINGKYDVAVLTFEMFLGLAVGNASVLPRIGLVVMDEAQFIADPQRGIVVELILTFLRAARARGVAPQLLALSATMGALNHFDAWLGVPALVSAERPVPLEFGVLDRSGVFEYIDANGQPAVRQLLARGAVRQRGQKPGSQDVIVPLVRQLLADEAAREKILIFRNRRGPAEGCAQYLAAERVLPPAEAELAALPTHDRTSASEALARAFAGGTALHNADLSVTERIAVERAFRDPESRVRVLVATSGVAAGINTPASTVIIVEHGYPWDNREFTVAEVRNMAGRAGRLGYRETGRAIVLADTPLERQRLFRQYATAAPEPARSSFRGADVGTWLLRLFAQVAAVPEGEVAALLANTYGGYLAALADPAWSQRATAEVTALVTRMTTLELLERDDEGRLRLTLLGRVCGRSSLSLASALRLVAAVRRPRSVPLTPEFLMGLVQGLPELDARYTPLAKGQGEARWPQDVGLRFGNELARALQEQAGELPTYWRRAKRVCLLAAWIAGEPVADIERRFTLNPYQGAVGLGDIRGTADLTRFHLSSAFEIAQVAAPDGAPNPAAAAALMRRLEVGLPEALLDLLAVRPALIRGEALALGAAGLTTATAVAAAPAEQLVRILGPVRAGQVLAVRRGMATAGVTSPVDATPDDLANAAPDPARAATPDEDRAA